jgi:hypothetical protein
MKIFQNTETRWQAGSLSHRICCFEFFIDKSPFSMLVDRD